MFFEGGGYKLRAVCHGARTVHLVHVRGCVILNANVPIVPHQRLIEHLHYSKKSLTT